ncbi:hypothetical protein KIPB_010345, partial [Kipferlia bialata]
LTEPEARYLIEELIKGVQYIHSKSVIHRDLKLGNLFLTGAHADDTPYSPDKQGRNRMHLRIGDFGLAVQLRREGEKRASLCGTPNYLAPETLCTHIDMRKERFEESARLGGSSPPTVDRETLALVDGLGCALKRGHDYSVDTWAIGVVMHTLLHGTPPFEGPSVGATYKNILSNNKTHPAEAPVSPEAGDLIDRLLTPSPEDRITLADALQHPWFTSCPTSPLTCLPESSLSSIPSYATPAHVSYMEGVMEAEREKDRLRQIRRAKRKEARQQMRERQVQENVPNRVGSEALMGAEADTRTLCASPPPPLPRVVSWVDFRQRYGYGYQLDDGTVGVCFNDHTQMCLSPAETVYDYYGADSRQGVRHHISQEGVDSEGRSLVKKREILLYIAQYMAQNSLYTTPLEQRRPDPTDDVPLPCIRRFRRHSGGVIVRFVSKCIQVNFNDHTKVVIGRDRVGYVSQNTSVVWVYKTALFAPESSDDHYRRELLERLPLAKRLIRDMWPKGSP